MRLNINTLLMFATLFTLTILALVCNGCEQNPDKKEKGIVIEVKDIRPTTAEKQYGTWRGAIVKEREIDGCQYLMFDGLNTFVVVHKGNCENPIHYFMKVNK